MDQSEPAADGASGHDLDSALQLLSGEQRQVVLLVGLEGLSYAETAEVLQIPVGTVMSRLARGRERLRGADGLPGRRQQQPAIAAEGQMTGPAPHQPGRAARLRGRRAGARRARRGRGPAGGRAGRPGAGAGVARAQRSPQAALCRPARGAAAAASCARRLRASAAGGASTVRSTRPMGRRRRCPDRGGRRRLSRAWAAGRAARCRDGVRGDRARRAHRLRAGGAPSGRGQGRRGASGALAGQARRRGRARAVARRASAGG